MVRLAPQQAVQILKGVTIRMRRWCKTAGPGLGSVRRHCDSRDVAMVLLAITEASKAEKVIPIAFLGRDKQSCRVEFGPRPRPKKNLANSEIGTVTPFLDSTAIELHPVCSTNSRARSRWEPSIRLGRVVYASFYTLLFAINNITSSPRLTSATTIRRSRLDPLAHPTSADYLCAQPLWSLLSQTDCRGRRVACSSSCPLSIQHQPALSASHTLSIQRPHLTTHHSSPGGTRVPVLQSLTSAAPGSTPGAASESHIVDCATHFRSRLSRPL